MTRSKIESIRNMFIIVIYYKVYKTSFSMLEIKIGIIIRM